VDVVETRFWLPIGTVEAWQAAQSLDLASMLTARRNETSSSIDVSH
jgi:hypothetical protein